MSPEQGPGVPGTVLNGTQSNKVGLAGSKAVNAKFDDAINANLVWGGGRTTQTLAVDANFVG